MNQNFEGKGVSIPQRKKETRYGRYHGRNNNLLLPPISPPLRKLSIYEDPLVWADSREKKGSPTASVSRVVRWYSRGQISLCLRLEVCSSKDEGGREKSVGERGRIEGGFYRLSTRAGKRAQLDGFKHGLPLFPTTSTTPYLGHCSRVVKMERYRVCAARRSAEEEEAREKFPCFLKLES